MDYRSVLTLSIVLCLILANVGDVSTALTHARSNVFQSASAFKLADRHRRRRRQDLQVQQDQMIPDDFNQQGDAPTNLQSNDMTVADPNAAPEFDSNANTVDITQKKKRK